MKWLKFLNKSVRVMSYDRDNAYAFRQYGHQCNCEGCNQYKGDIDTLKWVVCRT